MLPISGGNVTAGWFGGPSVGYPIKLFVIGEEKFGRKIRAKRAFRLGKIVETTVREHTRI